MNREKTKERLQAYFYIMFSGVTSFCFVLGMAEYFFDSAIWGTQSICNCLLWVGCFLLLKELLGKQKRKVSWPCLLFSGCFSGVLIIGRYIYFHPNFSELFPSMKKLLLFVMSLYGLTVVFSVLFSFMIEKLIHLEERLQINKVKLEKLLPFMGVFLFLAWIPCYLAYYPGILAYDISDQIQQIMGSGGITRFHPPLHTWFWKLCLVMGKDAGTALVIYSIVQMLLLAMAFTYVLYFMIKQRFHIWLIVGAFLFFGLNPTIAILSFVPVKDVMFTIVFVVFAVELAFFLADTDYTKKVSCHVRMILSGVLCCLLRNNMVYALIPTVIVMLFLLRKHWKPILLWGISIIAGYALINGPVYTALGVKPGNVREMLSVPMQQITYVNLNHVQELSEEDKEEINKYLPLEELAILYNPRFADPIKGQFDTEYFKEDGASFLKLWFRLFLKYPDEYLFSFLNLNLPYWYPDANTLDGYSARAYIETTIIDVLDEVKVTRESKLPGLLVFYEEIASYETFKTTPILSNLFAISTPIWVLLGVVLVLTEKKRTAVIIPLLPALFVWCTFLLGPVSNFRYMFPIMALYPLYLALAIQPKQLKEIL